MLMISVVNQLVEIQLFLGMNNVIKDSIMSIVFSVKYSVKCHAYNL